MDIGRRDENNVVKVKMEVGTCELVNSTTALRHRRPDSRSPWMDGSS